VAGFVLSSSAAGLLLFSAGIAAPLTLILGGLGIFYGRRGRRKVDSGETHQHRGLAQAGFIIGIVSVVLSLLAAAGWISLFVFVDDFNSEFDFEQEPEGLRTVAALRILAGL